jgi:DNA modification methylase
VEYDPDWRNRAGLSNTKRTGKVLNDDRADWTEAWKLFPGDVVYVWHGARHCVEVASSIERAGFEVRTQIIWAKSRFALGRGNYHWQHEPCWYGVRVGRTAHWIGDRSQSTVWSIPVTDNGETSHHGTQKPIEAMGRPIRNHDSEHVYEPFAGSGTTLIACELLGRRCFAMELSPGYCDVVVQRWENRTGGKAVLEGTGEGFGVVGVGRDGAGTSAAGTC